MAGLLYDAGALLAAQRNDRRMWAIHRRALERGVIPVVPTPVLAQAWRFDDGPSVAARQRGRAVVERFLEGCLVEPLDESTARAAGAALARSDTADVVDASVVVAALAQGSAVATSDHRDLERIADALGRRLAIVDV
jgi:hypothetical protein